MCQNKLTHVGKLGLALFTVGAVVFLVSFSVPFWAVKVQSPVNYYVGLWAICGANQCFSTVRATFVMLSPLGAPSWYIWTQGLACLALIAVIADFIVRLLFLSGRPLRYLFHSIILDFVACVLAILAAAVFGSKIVSYVNLRLHFGFAFNIIGGVFFALSGVCFLVEFCRYR